MTRHHDDRGATTAAVTLAVGIVLLIVVMVLQVITFTYAKGSVRAALDEAARTGARSTTPVDTCQQQATLVLGDLLGGTLGQSVRLACTDDGDRVVATATGEFTGWFGSLTTWTVRLSASAAKEDQ